MLELAHLAVGAARRRSWGRPRGSRGPAPERPGWRARRRPRRRVRPASRTLVVLERAAVDPVGAQARARRRGSMPAMQTSAMPKAGNAAVGSQPEPLPRVEEACGTWPASTGSAPLSAMRRLRQVERLVGPAQRPGGEHVGEVGPGGARAAELGDPAHPADRAWPGSPGGRPAPASVPVRHRDGQQPDQAHVVVERQPRHEHVVVGSSSAACPRRRGCCRCWRCGSITPLGSEVEPLGELQDREARRGRRRAGGSPPRSARRRRTGRPGRRTAGPRRPARRRRPARGR